MPGISRLPIRYAVITMSCAAGLAAAVWKIVFLVQPQPPAPFTNGGEIAATSIALACVLTLLLMIEAVAHERLVSDAFNPLAQRDSERLKINQRVLQNTLEQLPLFAAGIVMICWLYPPATAFHPALAATIVWILSRWAFWAGYHLGPQHRIGGLVGAAQSMIILVVTLAVLGARIGGLAGALLIPGLFSAGELIIILRLRAGR